MLRSLITTHARIRPLVAAALLYALAAVPMFVWPGLVSRVADRCGGLPPLDVRGHWTVTDARELVQACGPAGRTAYSHLQLLDLAYPAAAGAMLLLGTALVLRRYGGRGSVLLLPALIMTVLDYAENAAVWTLLVGWPHVEPAVAAIGGPTTAVKRVVGFAAFSIPLLLALAEATRRIRSRRKRSAQRRSGRAGGIRPLSVR